MWGIFAAPERNVQALRKPSVFQQDRTPFLNPLAKHRRQQTVELTPFFCRQGQVPLDLTEQTIQRALHRYRISDLGFKGQDDLAIGRDLVHAGTIRQVILGRSHVEDGRVAVERNVECGMETQRGV